VVLEVEAVGHREHVVEAREEDVAVAHAERLREVGVEARLERLEVHFPARRRRHGPRAVVVELDDE